MSENDVDQAERKIRNFAYGLINFAGAFAVVCGLWFVFFHPNGMMALYTPMYGFSLLVAFVASIVLIGKTVDFYPFVGPMLGTVQWGLVRTAVAVVTTLFLIYGFFWGFIGRFGITYFSPYSIVTAGGVGSEIFNARENASTAIVYVLTTFVWVALTWSAGFRQWPWGGLQNGSAALARVSIIGLLSIIAYVVLFHPHVCYLFFPAQTMAGVEPWWSKWAMTSSAYYNLGFLLSILLWVIISDVLWEGYPWQIVDRKGQGNLVRGLFTLIGTFVLGIISFTALLAVMNIFWSDPFEGGQYTDAPYFRYLHAGEISTFVALSALIVRTYFGNLIKQSNIWIRATVRTIAAAILGAVFYFFYYSWLSTLLLGKVPGVAQPEDTPLAWTLLFLSVVLIQADFFAGWPLVRKEK